MTRHGAAAMGLAALVVALDQAAKYWVLSVLLLPQLLSTPLIGPVYLTMVWNPGVSFGLLQMDHGVVRWVLAVFSVGVAVLLASWVRKSTRPLFAGALGLIMGGAIGNVIDRIRFGAVVDFIDVSRLHFPWVFNVADAAINIGIACLLLDMLIQDRRERAAKAVKDAA